MEKLKSGSVQMSQTIYFLRKEFQECIGMAEKNKDLGFVIKGNYLGERALKLNQIWSF